MTNTPTARPPRSTSRSTCRPRPPNSRSPSPSRPTPCGRRPTRRSPQLLSIDPADDEARTAARAAVDAMGRDLQTRSATRSRMLQAPLKDLSHGTEDGGEVARSLSDLRIEVEKLDPSGLDTDAGWFSRLVGRIPGVGTPLKRYFMRYESSQTQIDSIVQSLEKGRDQLKRDNVTLGDDQKQMRELTHALTDQVALAQALDASVVDKLATEIGPDDPRRQFVEEDILFALRQRTLDLQQQLAVNQQGVLAIEIIIRNNRELVRGVDRALDVTISALQVAVTVALALAHQKIVLDKIEAINTTTSAMIAGTAERLKTQGTQIHEQASSTMLDMEALSRRSPTSTRRSTRSRAIGARRCPRWRGRSSNSISSRPRPRRRSSRWSPDGRRRRSSSGSGRTIDIGEITSPKPTRGETE